MSLKKLSSIYHAAKKEGYVLSKSCEGNWLKCRHEWEKFAKKKVPTRRSELWKRAKELGFKGRYVKSTNEDLRRYIEVNSDNLVNFITSNEYGRYDMNDYDINEIPEILTDIFGRESAAIKDYIFLLGLVDSLGFVKYYTLNPTFFTKFKSFFLRDETKFYGEVDIDDISSIFIEKQAREVHDIPSNAFLPYELTDIAKKDEDIAEWWKRYVPLEGDGLDCIGNCIKIAEGEGRIPIGSFTKYCVFKANNNNNYAIRQKDWRYIAEKLDIRILVHTSNKHNKLILKYGDPSIEDTILELYSFMDHCFLAERTIFSEWSINEGYPNEIEPKNEKTKLYDIIGVNPKNNKLMVNRHSKTKINSLKFIELMITNDMMTKEMSQSKMLDQITYKMAIDHTKEIEEGFSIEKEHKIKKACSPFPQPKEDGKIAYDDRIYADFETIIENVNGKLVHKQDMLVTLYKGKVRTYCRVDIHDDSCLPSLRFLKDIQSGVYGKSDNYMVIFHNLGYDFNFIAETPGLFIKKRLTTTAAKLKCATTYYYGKLIYFKDSYSVISYKLADFNRVFGFTEEYKKGACPYGYYTNDTIKKKWGSIMNARKHVREKDMEDFNKSIIPYINPSNKCQFNHNQHRLDYCIQDVKILQKGYETFREWVDTMFGEELDFCVSIPQIAFNHLNNEHVFDEVYEVSDIAQNYLQNFVVGGRCMSAYNEKYILNDVQDFDANSLYPSAMCRPDFCVPVGKGRKISEKEIEEMNKEGINYLSRYSASYLSFNITKVGKKRAFPCIHSRDKGFTNEPDSNEVIFAGKVSMEDMVKYQEIEFTVLGGLVFDELPKENTLTKVITDLFNERNKLKKEGKKSQELVKLIMNAAYGRMIMKPHDTDEKWFSSYSKGEFNHKKYKEFIHRHYNYVKEISEFGNLVCIEKYKSILDHKNYATVGINVLDMSKRIMNEVMYLAEDNNINIYYQDTDSMHLPAKDVPELLELFSDEHGRSLEGKSLQQFCSDFEAPPGYKDPISKTCIIVGKKCYLDVIESTSVSDDKIKHEDLHVRMKGIPANAIYERAEKNGITVEQLYRDLYNGKRFRFDMLAKGGVSFDFNNFTVTSKAEFYREIFFE